MINLIKDPHSLKAQTWKRFRRRKTAMFGLYCIGIIFLIAIYAPFIANNQAFLIILDGSISFPFLQAYFAPLTPEAILDRIYNFIAFYLLVVLLSSFIPYKTVRKIIRILLFLLILMPFFLCKPILNRNIKNEKQSENSSFVISSPVPYGPNEQTGAPYQHPSSKHILGTDKVGRDVLSRIIYGARISLAVGIFAVGLSLSIGIFIGLTAGYKGGLYDLILMRIVEIVICFPTFLLLLILMTLMLDKGGSQSILLVALVIGLTGWTGVARLVRGEVLKQKTLAYVTAAQVLGFSHFRIMFRHILPNVSAPILVSATFGIAGAILAETGLSFLGFGVQPPTASWGELVNQALVYPLGYYHLTLWPGFIIFFTVTIFNLVGEGLRDAFDIRS
ncbi:MAG: ABC transporter permease [Verrucomicrobiota bacterium]|nr:ABC transporter permease [Verrucomicrobiota bacterium]